MLYGTNIKVSSPRLHTFPFLGLTGLFVKEDHELWPNIGFILWKMKIILPNY